MIFDFKDRVAKRQAEERAKIEALKFNIDVANEYIQKMAVAFGEWTKISGTTSLKTFLSDCGYESHAGDTNYIKLSSGEMWSVSFEHSGLLIGSGTFKNPVSVTKKCVQDAFFHHGKQIPEF